MGALIDYGGLLLVLFIICLVAGPSVLMLVRDMRRPGFTRIQRMRFVLSRLQLSFSISGVSFFLLSIFSTLYNQKFVWENIVWGFFCGLILMWLNTFSDQPT